MATAQKDKEPIPPEQEQEVREFFPITDAELTKVLEGLRDAGVRIMGVARGYQIRYVKPATS